MQIVIKENSEIYMKLGGAYSDIGKNDLGLKYTQKAIDLDPNFVIAIINKGKMLSRVSGICFKQLKCTSNVYILCLD